MNVLVAQLCPTPRLFCPLNSPGKNIGVGSHSLLQGTFLTQGLNPSLLHCRGILYSLSHQPFPNCTFFLSPDGKVLLCPFQHSSTQPSASDCHAWFCGASVLIGQGPHPPAPLSPWLLPFSFSPSPPLLSFPSPPLPVQGKEAGREEAASQFGNWQFGNWHPGSLKLIPFSLIPDLEITVPIRHSQHMPGKVEYGVYESGPRKSVFPPRTELRRGDWKTDSTSSTASKQVAPGAFTAGLQQVPLGLGNMLYDEPRRY